ncbi:DNA replication complex GINS protein PSF3-like [Ornithodoros turicata]
MSAGDSGAGDRHGVFEYTDYFSLDEILTTNERIPCKIELSIPNFGSLDPSSESPDLKPGTKLDLPLWLARQLLNRHVIAVEVPKVYRETYREILSADAAAVDLYRLQPHFYNFGLHIQNLPVLDADDISQALIQAFKSRLRKIMDRSQNGVQEDATGVLTAQLDNTERSLFAISQKAALDFKRWQGRQSHKISTVPMVVNHRKRKRAALDTSS